jgi:SNF2 family DNA or RNA helicase
VTAIACQARVRADHAGVLLVADDARSGSVARLLEASGLPIMWGAGRTAAGVPASVASRLLEPIAGLKVVHDAASLRFCENRRGLHRDHDRLRGLLSDLPATSRANLEASVPELEDVATLDAHQLRNVVAMTADFCRGLCVFDEQGVGKTITGIYSLDVLFARDQASLALVVAPKSMVPEWPSEIARFRPGTYSVDVLDGDRRAKRRVLRRRRDVLICNFETVVSLEEEISAVLKSHTGRCLLYVDESFFVKNADARRSRALRRVREWCSRCFVLCGTPAPNRASDLVAQVSLADLGATFGSVAIPDDRRAAHVAISEALGQRGAYVRNLKQVVLPDLPARRFEVVRVDLSGDQLSAYRHALDALLVDLRAESDEGFGRHLASWAARRSALLQICSDPTGLIPGFTGTPAKQEALDDLVRRFVVEGHEKLVIWSFYRASVEALCKRYSHLGVVRYDGSAGGAAARRELVRAFQESPEIRILVANPAAAGAGLTLHAARLAVYESMSNQAAHWLQSLDRIHRRGQAREVTYVVLLCRDTLEEREYARLREKERSAHDLLSDDIEEPPTRERMLHELVAATRQATAVPRDVGLATGSSATELVAPRIRPHR